MDGLPKELQICIMEYDANHRVNFRRSLKEIPIKGSFNRCNEIWKEFKKRDDGGVDTFHHVINDCMNDKLYIFETLESCRCCERHLCSRPNIGEYPGYNSINQDQHNCKCKCRQVMRDIARASFIEDNPAL